MSGCPMPGQSSSFWLRPPISALSPLSPLSVFSPLVLLSDFPSPVLLSLVSYSEIWSQGWRCQDCAQNNKAGNQEKKKECKEQLRRIPSSGPQDQDCARENLVHKVGNREKKRECKGQMRRNPSSGPQAQNPKHPKLQMKILRKILILQEMQIILLNPQSQTASELWNSNFLQRWE